MSSAIRSVLFFLTATVFTSEVFAAENADWSKDFERPAVEGPFTKALTQLAETFNRQTWDTLPEKLQHSDGTLALQCYFDPNKETAVGIVQYMEIAAPFAEVQKQIENVRGYLAIFNGYKKIELLETQGDRWLTSWEQDVPFPYPNVSFRLLHSLYRNDDTRIYRTQLASSDELRYSDGLIAIRVNPADPQRTQFLELNFWDVSLVIGGMTEVDRAREENAAAIFLADRTLQLKTEHPKTDLGTVRRAAKRSLNPKVIQDCVAGKGKFVPFWK